MKQNVNKDARAKAQAARRVAQLAREAAERVAAEAKLEHGDDLTVNDMAAMLGSAMRLPQDVPEVAPAKRSRVYSYDFTAEDIMALREAQRLSWKQIAANLNLGRSGAARLAYKRLTGKDPRDSFAARRRVGMTDNSTGQRRKFFAPQWNDDSDQDEIIERLTRAKILVQRNCKGTEFEEEIRVGTVQRLTWDGPDEELCVHFSDYDNGGTRSVLVRNIKEVR